MNPIVVKPAPKPKPFGWGTVLGASAGALLIGLLIGGSGGEDPTPTSAPVVVSSSCTAFVNSADKLIDLQSQGFTIAGEAINSAAGGDEDAIPDATVELNSLTEQVGTARSQYDINKLSCR